MAKRPKPIILTVLDGWGFRAETKGNAVALARKPNYDQLIADFPNTLIHTSGPFVGLPEGQMGNSEVGHLNLGAGRIVHQDLTRINKAIAAGELKKNRVARETFAAARGHRLHLLGLISDGGVHSHYDHMIALANEAKAAGIGEIFVHAFTDGRDTSPTGGREYLKICAEKLQPSGA